MSRSGSLQQVLGDTEVRVKAIKPNGDCFYEAISAAFMMMSEDVRECSDVIVEEGDSGAMSLRRTAAMSVDEEVFDSFNMYHLAGLSDFNFMRRIRTVEDLRDRLLVSGVGAGAGHCQGDGEDHKGLENHIGSTMQITCKVTQPSSHTLPQDPLFQPNRRVGYCEFR